MRNSIRLAAASFATLATMALASCTPEMATAPAVDPAAATYAAALGINIASMTKTASGLYYQDVPPGTGVTVATGNTVTVKYTGYFTNGSVFDSNSSGFKVTSIGSGSVIAGWEEGLVGMKVGGTRKLVIPPSLGYGSANYNSIPGNSILVFSVTLVSIP